MYNMAGRLLRCSMRGQTPLSRPHPVKLTRAQRFHATAANLAPTIPHFAREFQAKGIYTDYFPCTLHYYSSRGPKLALFDYKSLFSGSIEKYGDLADYPYYIHEDSVCVGNNGLVNPADRSQCNYNGLNMWPNTLLMLQIMRSYSEAAEDFREGGEDVPVPWIFTITKGNIESLRIADIAGSLGGGCADITIPAGGLLGTPLPRNLFLVNQERDTFWLLPREATTLTVLNEELNKLFDSHGTRMPEGEWGAKNSIQGYNTGSEERQWMSR